ncbi:MAG TPA: helix-turn-helix domain-containing protein [Acidimicrobiales bacterium]|jgi:transposase|nr:helix-turn-helix domain-containing protein [Acidimicrobiales bacterium]
MTTPLHLSADQRRELRRIAASYSQPYRRVVIARALLLVADGVPTADVAQRCETTPTTVRRWSSRFAAVGIDGLGTVGPGRGRKPSLRRAVADAIARDTEHTEPPPGTSRWTLRTMASRHGVSKDTVARVWRERGLRPWEKPPRPTKARPTERRRRPSEARESEVIEVLSALNEATGLALSRCRPRDVHRDFLFFVKLTEAIELWVEHWDDPSRPFHWQSREEVVSSTKRAREALTNYAKSAPTRSHQAR